MAYEFNSTQTSQIQSLLTAAINGTGTYADIYDYIFDEITDNGEPATNVDPSVWLWVQGAR